MDINSSANPLLEINTSFSAYLDARTRTSTEHMVDGRMDYAFDGDFSGRAKINTVSGWSKLYKMITAADIPNEFKKVFRSADTATSMLFANAYNAANVCSERLQARVPTVMVKTARDIPEIYSLTGEGFDPCIVLTSDIAEMCSMQELYYLFGCEIGRMQNNHSAYDFAFTYPGISVNNRYAAETPEPKAAGETRQLSYALNSWLRSADLTADRAGIICLDDPAAFPEIYASIRKKALPDSFGNTDTNIDLDRVREMYDIVHKTPVRSLKLDPDTTQDERRIMAGMEFIACEILYSWRPDLDAGGIHLTNKQTLEIRCEILAGAEESPNV